MAANTVLDLLKHERALKRAKQKQRADRKSPAVARAVVQLDILERKIQRMTEQRRELMQELQTKCPHLVVEQKLESWAGYDTLGNHKSTEYMLSCAGCHTTLDRWSEE